MSNFYNSLQQQNDDLFTPITAENKEITMEEDDTSPVVDPISRALEISMVKKRVKIGKFLEQYKNNLEAHFSHLHAFACSTGGLLEDGYREKIWPLLAKNIPQAKRYKDSTPQSLFSDSSERCVEPENSKDDQQQDAAALQQQQLLMVSDSDFESALSTFSSSAFDTDLEDDDDEDEKTAQSSPVHEPSIEQLRSHRDWNQVELDVARTLARFPPNIDDDERALLQQELTPLIVKILYEHEEFQYYQGFHDVCLTFLLVLGAESALKVTRTLCRRGAFYNYLSCTLEESALHELQDLYLLLFVHDQEVEKRLRNAELGTLFALSWPLTWFSHALQSYSQIVLFFDLFLCSHQLMPIYVTAALVSERREQILRCDPDMPSLHQLLNHIPPDLNCHRILDNARLLMERYPPSVLGEFRDEYVRICERHKMRMAVELRLQKRMEMDLAIYAKRRRSSAMFQSLLQRDKIYALAGAGAVALLSAAFVHYWPYKQF